MEDQKPPSMSDILEELKKLCDMGLPITIMNYLIFLRAFISVIFLGHLGSLALAGVTLSIGFTNMTGYSILVGLASGLEPICSQAHGSHNYDVISLSLRFMLLILFLATIPISLLWLNLEPIMLFMGQPKPITSIAATHCLYTLPDLLTNTLLQPLRVFLRSQKEIKPMMYCNALATVMHLPVNYFLVVKMGLGVPGVAVGAVVTNAGATGMMAAYAVWMWRRKKERVRVREREENIVINNGSVRMREVVRLGVGSCVGLCLEWWWYEMGMLMSGYLPNPTLTVAAMGILVHTTTMFYTLPVALAASVSVRVGNELGADKPYKAKLAAMVALRCGFLMGFFNLIMTVILREWWAGLFTKDKGVKALVVFIMPLMGLCEVANCLQTTCSGILRGTARPIIKAHINLGSFYFVGIPVAVGLGFLYKAGFIGLWLGLLAAQIACAILSLYVVVVGTDWEMEALKATKIMGICNNNRKDDDESKKGFLMKENGNKS